MASSYDHARRFLRALFISSSSGGAWPLQIDEWNYLVPWGGYLRARVTAQHGDGAESPRVLRLSGPTVTPTTLHCKL